MWDKHGQASTLAHGIQRSRIIWPSPSQVLLARYPSPLLWHRPAIVYILCTLFAQPKEGIMYRHGDVIIVAAAEVPADARPRHSAVLARGEATGHSHRISDPSTVEIFEARDAAFLRVNAESAMLIHDEHKPIELPRGVYRFWQQREYTPKAIRTVVD